jgi:hypothetical protein
VQAHDFLMLLIKMLIHRFKAAYSYPTYAFVQSVYRLVQNASPIRSKRLLTCSKRFSICLNPLASSIPAGCFQLLFHANKSLALIKSHYASGISRIRSFESSFF